MTTRMETYSGKLVDLSAPDPKDICIEDIAWHLSRTSRFVGAAHSEETYSVAQHSVLVLNRVKQTAMNVSKELLLTALLRNAYKAYMGDIAIPMSNLLDMRGPIQRLRERLQRAIYKGLLGDIQFDAKPFVQVEDLVIDIAKAWALSYEAYHLMHSKGRHYPNHVFLSDEYVLRTIIVWPAEYAAEAFKNHYAELLPK